MLHHTEHFDEITEGPIRVNLILYLTLSTEAETDAIATGPNVSKVA